MLLQNKFLGVLLLITGIPLAAQQPPLKLATLEYPPFIHQNRAQAEGEIIDIVKEIFSRLGRAITIEFFPSPRGLNMVSTGIVDAMFTLKKNADREITMTFPKEPLISQDYVFFARSDSKISFDGNLATMANVNIGIANQTSYGPRFDAAVKNGDLKKIETAPNFESNFKKLLAGRLDVVINSRDVGNQIIATLRAEAKVKILGTPVETVSSYLVFTKKRDYTALADAFDKVVAAMKKDGTIEKIKKRYK